MRENLRKMKLPAGEKSGTIFLRRLKEVGRRYNWQGCYYAHRYLHTYIVNYKTYVK